MARKSSSLWRRHLHEFQNCGLNGHFGQRAGLAILSTEDSRCHRTGMRLVSAESCSRSKSTFTPKIQARFLARAASSPKASPSTPTTFDSTSQVPRTLLEELRNPRLTRSIVSNNSISNLKTAIEMAFKASGDRYGWDKDNEIEIIGLKGSHGSNVKGYFFDFPQVKLKNDSWIVDPPTGMKREFCSRRKFEKLEDVFDLQKRYKETQGQRYREYIEETVEILVKGGKKLGAVLLEPVCLGSGSMQFVDPLFQYALVQVIRNNPLLTSNPPSTTSDCQTWNGLPIIFDETFTGFFGLGRLSSASFLQVHPDISVHTKTPTKEQSTTFLSQSIFDALSSSQTNGKVFDGDAQLSDPSLGEMRAMATIKGRKGADKEWLQESRSESKDGETKMWSIWSNQFIRRLSLSRDVESVVALGSVLVVHLYAENTGSWSPKTADGLLKRVQLEDPKSLNTRPGVFGKKMFYVVGNLESRPFVLRSVEGTLEHALL